MANEQRGMIDAVHHDLPLEDPSDLSGTCALVIVVGQAHVPQGSASHIPAGLGVAAPGPPHSLLCTHVQQGGAELGVPGHQVPEGHAGLALHPLLLLDFHDLECKIYCQVQCLSGVWIGLPIPQSHASLDGDFRIAA